MKDTTSHNHVAGASREASRSPVLSAPSGPRYQPPLSPERLQAEAPDQVCTHFDILSKRPSSADLSAFVHAIVAS
jgi:hypothetical protein